MGPHIPQHQIRSHRATRTGHQRSHHHAIHLDALEPRTFLSTTPTDPSGRPIPSGPPAASTSIFLSISTEATTYGAGVNLVARVLATGIANTDGMLIDFIDQQPTGNVLLAAATVQNNTVSYNWTSGSVGDHQVIAKVASPAFAPAASEPFAVAVSQASTQIVIAGTSSGQLKARVTSTADVNAGTVSFFEGTRELGTAPVAPDGSVAYTPSKFRSGNHVIVAAYNGSTDYAPSTSTTLPLHISKTPSLLDARRTAFRHGWIHSARPEYLSR